ncbi:MAG: protease inhibitor I42 family protein, partial [Halobacteriota archaeon]
MDVTPTAVPAPVISGDHIIAAPGHQFPISLHGNPTTGYNWQPTFDTSVLSLQSQTFVSDFPNDIT